jgi:hypothetical protein
MRFRSLAALAALTPTAVCRLLAQDERAALLAVDRAAAQLSSDSGFVAALQSAALRDAVLLWPGAPVAAGADEVRSLLGSLPSRDSVRLVWQPLGLELARDSSLESPGAIAVASPRTGDAPPRARPSGATVPFVDADLAFARLAGERGAAVPFRHWAAADAFTLGGGGLMTRGPTEIGKAVAGLATWRWHPVAAGASRSGDLGWTVGEAIITPKDSSPEYGKYLTVWIGHPGEAIRFLTDGGNARPPTP